MKITPYIFVLLLVSSVLAELPQQEKPGITQGNIFYGLDIMFENIQILFTSDEFVRVQKQIRFNEERLSEIQKLSQASGDKSKQIEKTRMRYEKSRTKIEENILKIKDRDDKELALKLSDAKTQQHLIILNDLKGRVPSQALKGIENAINNSQKHLDKIKIQENMMNITW